eukprot:CAMPEP_0113476782 /NCGR_PEP_ID=MMETSP0014_2-20120614/19853_1 /TAXON_ID=2857 /ORGANISM="Nitzschia sp." /LENGTH=458 /DNA_ID=CAMNT_0000369823 /DNA_START=330 /DNA_END=1706 /DNA_ORIENTATION=- /assembly_acc=CAM_ASM_000159
MTGRTETKQQQTPSRQAIVFPAVVLLLLCFFSSSSSSSVVGAKSGSDLPTTATTTTTSSSRSIRQQQSYFSDWGGSNDRVEENEGEGHQRPTVVASSSPSSSSSSSRRRVAQEQRRSEPVIFGREHEVTLFETSPTTHTSRTTRIHDQTDQHHSSSSSSSINYGGSGGGGGGSDAYDDDDDDDDLMIPVDRYRQASSMRPSFAPSRIQHHATLSSKLPSSKSASASSSSSPLSATSRIGKIFNGFGIGGGGDGNGNGNTFFPKMVQYTQQWWTTNVVPYVEQMPKVVLNCQPTTTLKVRKTFRPLKTIIRFGADFNTQLGVWQFKSSWEDEIIGGKLTLVGRELQVSKSWQLSVGAVEDLVTRLRFRAAINLQTFQAYARVGLRTERLSPINVVDGITILKRIPLDGIRTGNVKLEVKANVALPQPEIEYSTETQRRSLTGVGDIEVNIDELNMLLDY